MLGSLYSFNDFYLDQCYVIDFESMVISESFVVQIRNQVIGCWCSLTVHV